MVEVVGAWVHSMQKRGLKVRSSLDNLVLVVRLLKLVKLEYPSVDSVDKLKVVHIDYMENYLHSKQVRGLLKPRSRGSYVCALRLFLRWCFKRELIKKNLGAMVELVRVPRNTPPTDVYSEQEVKDLIESMDGDLPQQKRNQMMAKLAYALGLRSSSIRYMSMDDIDWKNKELRVARAKGAKDGQKLPLHDVILDELRKYIDEVRPTILGSRPCNRLQKHSHDDAPPPDKIMFPTTSGLPLCQKSFLTVVKRAGTCAGVKNAKVHGLRHCTATHMIQRGADILDVNALLQHSDLSTTMLYLHLDKTRLLKSMYEFHPLLNGALYHNDDENRIGTLPRNEEKNGNGGNVFKDRLSTGLHREKAGTGLAPTVRNPIRSAIDGFHSELAKIREGQFATIMGVGKVVGMDGKCVGTKTQPVPRRTGAKNRTRAQATTQVIRRSGSDRPRGKDSLADP